MRDRLAEADRLPTELKNLLARPAVSDGQDIGADVIERSRNRWRRRSPALHRRGRRAMEQVFNKRVNFRPSGHSGVAGARVGQEECGDSLGPAWDM